MSKKIFICGITANFTTQNAETIEKMIQRRVDTICKDPDNPKQRLVGFGMKVTPLQNQTELDIEFTFLRNNFFAKDGVNPELINDSDAQLIMGLNGKFNPPIMWDLVQPFGVGRYHVPISEFVYAYSESCNQLQASKLKGLQIESSNTELKLKVRV